MNDTSDVNYRRFVDNLRFTTSCTYEDILTKILQWTYDCEELRHVSHFNDRLRDIFIDFKKMKNVYDNLKIRDQIHDGVLNTILGADFCDTHLSHIPSAETVQKKCGFLNMDEITTEMTDLTDGLKITRAIVDVIYEIDWSREGEAVCEPSGDVVWCRLVAMFRSMLGFMIDKQLLQQNEVAKDVVNIGVEVGEGGDEVYMRQFVGGKEPMKQLQYGNHMSPNESIAGGELMNDKFEFTDGNIGGWFDGGGERDPWAT